MSVFICILLLSRQDRTSVATHLPLAWSRPSKQEEGRLMSQLRDMEDMFTN